MLCTREGLFSTVCGWGGGGGGGRQGKENLVK